MKLNQLLEQLEWLFENRKIELIAKKQGVKIMKTIGRDRSVGIQITNELRKFTSDDISKIKDITAETLLKFFQGKIHKKYVQWLTNRYINKEFQLEDWRIIRDNLKLFDKVRNKLPAKDINAYKSISDLHRTTEALNLKDTRSNRQKDKEERAQLFKDKEAILFYKDADIKIEIPKSEEAACVLGKGTRWCTSARNHNMFHHYDKEGDLYIITTKDGKKFQFHLHTKQFMDEADTEVKMSDVLDDYPSILKAIPKLIDSLSMFDRASIQDMSYKETEEMIREWVKGGLFGDVEMYGDNDVIIEQWQSLSLFFRDYNFEELNIMLNYIDDPAELEHEMDLENLNVMKWINKDILNMIHKRLQSEIKHMNQPDLFDITTEQDIMNTLKSFTGLHESIVDDIKEDMYEATASKMEKYLVAGIKDEEHEHGVMGFLFDTDHSHITGYLLVTDEHRNFEESTYAMTMDINEISESLTGTGWEDISDNEFEHEMKGFFGSEFYNNPKLKSPDDFYRTQNMDNLKKSIAMTLNKWKGK